jgi:hypothetical protein
MLIFPPKKSTVSKGGGQGEGRQGERRSKEKMKKQKKLDFFSSKNDLK